jgi:DNA-binding SARP family transcriptional activator
MSIDIKLLGPLEAYADGVPIAPTASKPRQVLSMLAVNAGRLVTTSALVDELWRYWPPRSGIATVQTYILKLRNKLDEALAGTGTRTSREILITRSTGYLLDIERDEVDIGKYDKLATLGRRAVNEGDHLAASRILTAALGHWRGPALVDVAAGPQLEIEAMRLEEDRLSCLDLRIAADLCLGRHYQVLGELAALCARHPWQENFRALYMLALYRSGRQLQALEVFRQLRAAVIERHGLEPSPRLQQLHQAILCGDPLVADPTLFAIESGRPTALEATGSIT